MMKSNLKKNNNKKKNKHVHFNEDILVNIIPNRFDKLTYSYDIINYTYKINYLLILIIIICFISIIFIKKYNYNNMII
jgi:hypothetical protein